VQTEKLKKEEKEVVSMKLLNDRSIAFVKLLAKAKEAPITIRYCGKSKEGQFLWEVRQGDRNLALGTEIQVISKLKEY